MNHGRTRAAPVLRYVVGVRLILQGQRILVQIGRARTRGALRARRLESAAFPVLKYAVISIRTAAEQYGGWPFGLNSHIRHREGGQQLPAV
jgi:hypothetical protein